MYGFLRSSLFYDVLKLVCNHDIKPFFSLSWPNISGKLMILTLPFFIKVKRKIIYY